MDIAIIGLGLIGGSLARDLRNSGFAESIYGVDSNADHAEQAVELGLVDHMVSLEEAMRSAALIIVAVPVHHIIQLLPVILDRSEGKVVMDVGSTKFSMAKSIAEHPNRSCYVATHPMAGTEFSGPMAAISGLFENKAAIICDAQMSDSKAITLVTELYNTLGMTIIQMDSREHDLHAAYVSHISHISSFALALTVLKKEKDQTNIFNLASGGFDSTVRLAKSSKDMWTPIFSDNAANILSVIDTYISELQQFKQAISSQDRESLDSLISRANEIRKILK